MKQQKSVEYKITEQEFVEQKISELGGVAELTRLLAFTAACPEAPAWPADAWRSFLNPGSGLQEPRRVLFAVESGEGGLAAIVAVTLIGADTELELLLVRPGYRRQGLGRALSHHWLRWAAQGGGTRATLEVRASNEAAQRLYRELGFTSQGRRPGYYGRPREDALLLARDL